MDINNEIEGLQNAQSVADRGLDYVAYELARDYAITILTKLEETHNDSN